MDEAEGEGGEGGEEAEEEEEGEGDQDARYCYALDTPTLALFITGTLNLYLNKICSLLLLVFVCNVFSFCIRLVMNDS